MMHSNIRNYVVIIISSFFWSAVGMDKHGQKKLITNNVVNNRLYQFVRQKNASSFSINDYIVSVSSLYQVLRKELCLALQNINCAPRISIKGSTIAIPAQTKKIFPRLIDTTEKRLFCNTQSRAWILSHSLLLEEDTVFHARDLDYNPFAKEMIIVEYSLLAAAFICIGVAVKGLMLVL